MIPSVEKNDTIFVAYRNSNSPSEFTAVRYCVLEDALFAYAKGVRQHGRDNVRILAEIGILVNVEVHSLVHGQEEPVIIRSGF